jgi:hypothetical protein
MLTINVKEPDQIIFVATCPRSGSSAVSGSLAQCGAFIGTHVSKALNPKGFFENGGVNQIFQREWVIHKGEQQGVHFREKAVREGTLPQIPLLKERIALAFMIEGYQSGVALFKQGLYMFFAEQIQAAYPNAVWVLPARPVDEIADSMVRAHMAKTSDVARSRVEGFLSGYNLVRKSVKNLVEIDTNKMIKDGDRSGLQRVCDLSGLEFNEQGVDDFLDGSLWNRTTAVMNDARKNFIRPVEREQLRPMFPKEDSLIALDGIDNKVLSPRNEGEQ